MTPEQRSWKVAAALAHACGLDWGTWALGRTARCCPDCSWTDPPPDPCCAWCGTPLVPVANPSDVEAYLADCRRRGVEPGPLPSLEYRPGGGVSWYFRPRSGLQIRVGAACWATLSRSGALRFGSYAYGCEHGDLTQLADLARVAAEAMR